MTKNNGGTYIITCNGNGVVYHGSTSNFRRRWQDHRSKLRRNAHPNPYLQNAWNKYGEPSFRFDALMALEGSEIRAHEQMLLTYKFLTNQPGFNISKDATAPMAGRKSSDETRRKVSQAGMGRKVSAETRAKLSAAKKGRTLSATTRARISESKKGHKYGPMSEQHKANLSYAKSGKPVKRKD